jgi:hypothetical protein
MAQDTKYEGEDWWKWSDASRQIRIVNETANALTPQAGPARSRLARRIELQTGQCCLAKLFLIVDDYNYPVIDALEKRKEFQLGKLSNPPIQA